MSPIDCFDKPARRIVSRFRSSQGWVRARLLNLELTITAVEDIAYRERDVFRHGLKADLISRQDASELYGLVE